MVEYRILARVTRNKDKDINEVNRRLTASGVPITSDNQMKELLDMITEKLNNCPEIVMLEITKVERIF